MSRRVTTCSFLTWPSSAWLRPIPPVPTMAIRGFSPAPKGVAAHCESMDRRLKFSRAADGRVINRDEPCQAADDIRELTLIVTEEGFRGANQAGCDPEAGCADLQRAPECGHDAGLDHGPASEDGSNAG